MQGSAPGRPAAATSDWWWILDPRQSLRARAALLVGAGMLAITAVLTWSTGALYRRALEPQLSSQLESMAFQLTDKLDRAIYERYRTLTLGAGLPQVRQASGTSAERRRVLETLQESSPDFAWIGIADPTGRIVAATAGTLVGASAENRLWFRSAQETAYAGGLREIPELGRSNGTRSESSPARYLDLAVPLVSPDGEFAGVLGAHLRWDWAHDVLLSIVPETLTRDRIGATVYAGNDVLLDSGASGWTHPPDPPNIGELRRVRGAFVEHTTLGSSYVTGFTRSRGFREYRGLGWMTVVRQPVAQAFAPVDRLRRSIAGWGCMVSLGAMSAAWVLAGRHARRLRSVRTAAQRIHEGDILAVLPRPPGQSELARMCGAVGDLVEDLRARDTSAKSTTGRQQPGS